MSTNSIIKIKGGKSIYCHWDGYLSGNGDILLRHFKNKRKVKKLIEQGNVSGLESRINPSKKSKHSFSNPEKGVCIFYHRDRGEELMFGDSFGATIVYEFDNGSWYYSDHYHDRVKLTKEMTQEKD